MDKKFKFGKWLIFFILLSAWIIYLSAATYAFYQPGTGDQFSSVYRCLHESGVRGDDWHKYRHFLTKDGGGISVWLANDADKGAKTKFCKFNKNGLVFKF